MLCLLCPPGAALELTDILATMVALWRSHIQPPCPPTRGRGAAHILTLASPICTAVLTHFAALVLMGNHTVELRCLHAAGHKLLLVSRSLVALKASHVTAPHPKGGRESHAPCEIGTAGTLPPPQHTFPFTAVSGAQPTGERGRVSLNSVAHRGPCACSWRVC